MVKVKESLQLTSAVGVAEPASPFFHFSALRARFLQEGQKVRLGRASADAPACVRALVPVLFVPVPAFFQPRSAMLLLAHIRSGGSHHQNPLTASVSHTPHQLIPSMSRANAIASTPTKKTTPTPPSPSARDESPS